MKTILLATNFSKNANDAARYGFDLACQIRAKVILVNAMIIAAEVPQSGFTAWPDEEFDGLLQDFAGELERFKTELEGSLSPDAYHPPVHCINNVGRFIDVIARAAAQNNADLVVIGTHGGGLLSRFLLGDHVEQLIGVTTRPVLIVKPGTPFKAVKKIAFATDFKYPEKDLEIIYSLIPLAKLLNAEILLAHVSHKHEEKKQLNKTLTEYLVELSNRADYPNIYYRLIHNEKTEAGLVWLCEHGQVDMLAMAHRSRNILAKYFGHSYTRHMSKLSDLPLLIFPVTINSL